MGDVKRRPPGLSAAVDTAVHEVRLRAEGSVRLLERDADLRYAVPAELRPLLCVQCVVQSASLEAGTWVPTDDPALMTPERVLLMLDGWLVRRVTLEGRVSAELVGAGDLLRPGEDAEDLYSTYSSSIDWRAGGRVHLAILDDRTLSALARLPSVFSELSARERRRAQSLSLRLVLEQIPNLARRVELLLWHLADRWGRRERDRVILPLRISQGLLAELVGARRTSVNSALARLRADGRVSITPERTTVLHDPASLTADVDRAALTATADTHPRPVSDDR